MVVTVRPLHQGDVKISSRLHRDVLDMEFLARCGNGFIRCYHRAWVDSVHGIALAAVDGDGNVVGVLLGALRPDRHFRTIVRHHGHALAFWLLVRAMSSPRFAKELLSTRAVRYVRGLIRMLDTLLRRHVRADHLSPGGIIGADAIDTSSPSAWVPVIGEVTHVMVREDAQGHGVGRALLDEARNTGHHAGLDELVLVTPPDLAAGEFYEHLGWERVGELTSRSGEEFIRYHLSLHA
ncbi:MAG TPA: GNAT family N-acetyltransferase [Acidimicrobiales bacterium]|nr:GNAT family N-acetyltransferase [Acidimicrobiales bacterium]